MQKARRHRTKRLRLDVYKRHMATGGFSTKQNSIAYWDSAYIQYVIIIFTFMAGTNFGLLHTAIRGNWRKLIQDNEFQLYFTIVLLASVVIGVGLYVIGWADFEKLSLIHIWR